MKQHVKDQIIEVVEIAVSSKVPRKEAVTKSHAVLTNRGLNLCRSTIEKFYDIQQLQRHRRFLASEPWDAIPDESIDYQREQGDGCLDDLNY